jgi:flagellar basal body-associated protein FliL
MRKLIVAIILLPIITLLWLIGWSMFYTGSEIVNKKETENEQTNNEQIIVPYTITQQPNAK